MFYRHFRVEGHHFVPIVVTAIVWTLECLFCEMLRLIYPTKMITLHYEDLCNQPIVSFQRLERFAGVSLGACKIAAAYRLVMQPSHALSGNQLMRRKDIVFAPEVGLTRHLTPFDKAIVALCTFPLLIAYGYIGRRGTKFPVMMRPSPQ
jgi:hypothetical protein